MFKSLFPVLIILFLSACKKEIAREDIGLLDGYWEIERAEGPDGQSRSYRINTTVDYLQLEGLEGFRKKVQPQADGSFLTSDDATTFEIRQKDNRYFMVYLVDGMEWSEQLLKLDSMSFSVLNEEHITYHYKRYQSLLTHHGQQ